MTTETYTGTLAVLTCGECGIGFGVPIAWRDRRRRNHETFYCPNGHNRWFPDKSKEEILRAQLDDANTWGAGERRRREAAERSAASYKGQTTKIKNRIKAGVCPFCNRTFPNVARHMTSKHPDENPEA